VADSPAGSLRVEALGPRHDRNSFASGVEPLDRYFRDQAGQDARKNMAAPFVLVLPDGAIGGYYTLSATGVKLSEMPADITRKLPRYPLVPATLLGRLAVDQTSRSSRSSCSGRWWMSGGCSMHPKPEDLAELFRPLDTAKRRHGEGRARGRRSGFFPETVSPHSHSMVNGFRLAL